MRQLDILKAVFDAAIDAIFTCVESGDVISRMIRLLVFEL